MRLLILTLFLAITASMFSWLPAQAGADQGDIEVTRIEVESQYPNGMKFYIAARSSAEISEVRVFFRKTGRVTAAAYRDVDFYSVDSDNSGSGDSNRNSVEGEATLSTGLGSGYIPPGTEITYSFEIRDASGAVHQTPDQVAVYNDLAFEWESLTEGRITVLFYGEKSRERAHLVLGVATDALDRMAPVLGFDPTEPVRIVVYQEFRDMIKALPLRMQALQGRVLTEGMAFGEERVVLIDGFHPDYRGIASHEITHLVVAEVTGRAHSRVPSWLNEGLAEYGNINPSPEYGYALERGIINNQVPGLWLLSFFGGSGEDIIRAYGQGLSVVQYLIDTYGESTVAELMKEIQRSLDIDQALEAVCGLDQYSLDTAWRISKGMDPLPKPEERESLRALLPTVTPSPAPTPTQRPTPLPDPTPTTEPTATPQPTPTKVPPTPSPEPTSQVPGDDSPDGPASTGCSSPHPGNLGIFNGDPAILALLFAPLAMLAIRSRRGQ